MSKSDESDTFEYGVEIDTDYIRDGDPERADVETGEWSAPWLDRGPGSGAGDWSQDKSDETARRPSNDGRSETRTTFYDDVDGGSIDYDRLAKINDGVGASERGSQNAESDKIRVVEVIASTVDATSYQAERARKLVLRAGDLRETFPTRSLEEIALAGVCYALDADVTDVEHRSTNRDAVRELMDTLDMEPSDVFDLRRKLKRNL